MNADEKVETAKALILDAIQACLDKEPSACCLAIEGLDHLLNDNHRPAVLNEPETP